MMHLPRTSRRYGVEIKVPTVHLECEDLGEVLALLEGHGGIARVFDRDSRALVVDGPVNDVRISLGLLATADEEKDGGEEMEERVAVDASWSGEASRRTPDRHACKVQFTGAFNIASAYYYGDLGGVVRRRDVNGQESFFRPMITRL